MSVNDVLPVKRVKNEERYHVTKTSYFVIYLVILSKGEVDGERCWIWNNAGLRVLTGLWRDPVYLYGRRNLVTLERSSLMKERGNISLDSCAVYLK